MSYRGQKIACVIPARLESTRFPKKMLSKVAGKPLLEWVYMSAKKCPHFDTCLFAIDSSEVAAILDGIEAPYVMTCKDCPSGTDRLIEVRNKGGIKADVWVNWQADEPLVDEKMIDQLLQSCDDPCQDIWTLKYRSQKNIEDPSNVKVVTDERERALYFSRSPLPHGAKEYFKHVGLYAYSDRALSVIANLSPSPLELSENLEQLRFLEAGLNIYVHETQNQPQGVDLPEHLALVEKLLVSKTLV